MNVGPDPAGADPASDPAGADPGPDPAAEGGLPGADGAVRRVLRAELARARERRAGQPVRVLDVGGGTGVWAVPMAAAGCAVTVVDISPDALATLRGRALRAGMDDRITSVQGDVQTLSEVVSPGGADLVLGHNLLEVVDDVAAAVAQLAGAAAPGGAVSVLTAGRHAAALAQAHAGRLDEARAVLTDPAGRWGEADPLQRRLDATGLRGLLESAAGLAIEVVQGDGVFHGWLPASIEEDDPARLEDLEALVADHPELLVLAARLHVLARRTA
jgi:SAM-dependent methyltransferase